MFKSWLWKRRLKEYRISIREIRKATFERLSDIRFEIMWIVSHKDTVYFSSTGWAFGSWQVWQLRRMVGARWFDLNVFKCVKDRNLIMMKAKEFEVLKGK